MINVEHGASFGSGRGIRLGDHSGLGIDCNIMAPVSIGRDVMMGPNVLMVTANHRFDAFDAPIRLQG